MKQVMLTVGDKCIIRHGGCCDDANYTGQVCTIIDRCGHSILLHSDETPIDFWHGRECVEVVGER